MIRINHNILSLMAVLLLTACHVQPNQKRSVTSTEAKQIQLPNPEVIDSVQLAVVSNSSFLESEPGQSNEENPEPTSIKGSNSYTQMQSATSYSNITSRSHKRHLSRYDSDNREDLFYFKPGYLKIYSTQDSEYKSFPSFNKNIHDTTYGTYSKVGYSDSILYDKDKRKFLLQFANDDTNFRSGAYHSFMSEDSDAIPFVNHLDDDEKSDYIYYYPRKYIWHFYRSSDKSTKKYRFGNSASLPYVADFDLDGKADFSVYQKGTGNWYFIKSSTDYKKVTSLKGLSSITGSDAIAFLPQAADLDKDGKIDYLLINWKNNYMIYFLSSQSFKGKKRDFNFLIKEGVNELALYDVNGDGALDLVTSSIKGFGVNYFSFVKEKGFRLTSVTPKDYQLANSTIMLSKVIETVPTPTPPPTSGNPQIPSAGSASTFGASSGATVSSSGGFRRGSSRFTMTGRKSGSLSFQTRGIVHQNGTNGDGGWEYIFLTLRGENLDRILLHHGGGSGRKIRMFYSYLPNMHMQLSTDNLPGIHTWSLKWGGNVIELYLDGRRIDQAPFPNNAKINSVVVGGYDDTRRNFKGEWRNFILR